VVGRVRRTTYQRPSVASLHHVACGGDVTYGEGVAYGAHEVTIRSRPVIYKPQPPLA